MGLSFAFKLDSSFYIVSIVKTVFKKIETLTCSMFLPSEIPHCLSKSIICPCMEHYCHLVFSTTFTDVHLS